MLHRRSLTLLVCALALLIPAGLSISAGAQNTPSAAGRRVAVLFTGRVNDGSWNQAGYEGLLRAEAAGSEIAYTDGVAADRQLATFRELVGQDFDVIIGHGGEYMDAALEVAVEHPDQQFAVTNGDRSAANVTVYALDYRDVGMIAGAIAGLMSETNRVAVVAAEDIAVTRDAITGFTDGATRINPAAAVEVAYTGSWDDSAAAATATESLIAGGVDVVWPFLDAAGESVLSTAARHGASAIGLADSYGESPRSLVLAVVIADASNLVFEVATGSLDGKVHVQGSAAGAIGIKQMSPETTAKLIELIESR